MKCSLKRGSNQARVCLKYSVMVAAVLCAFGSAHAKTFNLGESNWVLSANTTVRLNLGTRVGQIDSKIATNSQYDESDYRFKQGDLSGARLDVLEEIQLSRRGPNGMFGVRVSGSGWYDGAYDNHVKAAPGIIPGTSVPYAQAGSYYNNEYSSYTKRYYEGPSGELLDAFVLGNFSIGDVPVGIKLGRHIVDWGVGMFFAQQAISYSQSPLDGIKATTSPGAKIKELFLPISQATFTLGLTDHLSLAGEYAFDWAPNRLPAGGTFLGVTDFLYRGADRLFAGAVGTTPLFLIRKNTYNSLDKSGQNWGVQLKYDWDWGGTAGLYYRNFAETYSYSAPLILPSIPVPDPHGGLKIGTYELVYHAHSKLVGVSWSQPLLGLSLGAELSYRKDAGLNNAGFTASGQGPTGNILSGLVNIVGILPRTPIWDTGVLAAELAYSHLASVTSNRALYNSTDNAATCPTRSTDAGCSTDNFTAVAVSFTPQYLQVFPGWRMGIPVTLNYGISGNYAGLGGGYEGALSYSIGVQAVLHNNYTFALTYIGSHARHLPTNALGYIPGGAGAWFYNDRDRVQFTASFSF